MNIDEKYNNLINHIKSLQSVIVAYSGGVDSTFLMKVCRLTLGKDNVLALTSSSPSRPENEIEEAIQLASENDVEHMVIQTDELRDDQYQHNTIDRCYHCKNHLNASFKAILDEKKKYKFIVNGTNIEDYNDYRPGIKADEKYNIISPLSKAQLTKIEIRELSRRLNLRTWDKPSKACLSTRIPFESEITTEKLKQIEQSEQMLINMGFDTVRVRHLGDIARIEVLPSDFKCLMQQERLEKIISSLKNLGFKTVTLDLEGYKNGKLNPNTCDNHNNKPLNI